MSYLNTDVPELKGYDTGTVLGNIERLEARMETVMEASLCQLSELAEAILRDASGDPDTVFSILLSLRGQQGEEEEPPLRNEAVLYQNHAPLRGMTKHLGLYERLVLYHLLLQKLPSLSVFEQNRAVLPLSAAAEGRIAYMASAMTDKAYMCFSNHIPSCRTAVFRSFVDACEEVRGGLCQYCILPLESASEGKLMGFAKLILKYSLQTVAVCDVKTGSGSSEDATRFGLLRYVGEENKALRSPLDTSKHPPSHLELLHVTAIPTYSEIIAAADFCGLLLRRADTLPSDNTHVLFTQDPRHQDAALASALPLLSTVWDVTSADLSVFLLFLALEAPEDPILGLYPAL